MNFLKKQYSLVPSTKKRSDYQITFNIEPLSAFTMQIDKKKGTLRFQKKEKFSHLSFFFNFLIQLFVLPHNVLLIHGSSVKKNKNGYIFSGPSGIGKTTTIKNIAPICIYSNDVAVIKKEGGKYKLLCSPFDSFYKERKKPVELKATYFLKQSKKFAFKKLQISKGYEYLLKNSIFYYYLDTIVVSKSKTSSKKQMIDLRIPEQYHLIQKKLLQLLVTCPTLLLKKGRDDAIYPILN